MNIAIKIKNNNVSNESDKTFRVKLTGANDKAFISPDKEVIVTIVDNDGRYSHV